MKTGDNLYVNAADICLSMGCDRLEREYVEIHATVSHPVRTIDLDEYTKKVQDDMMKALHEIIRLTNAEDRMEILGNGKSSVMTAIVDEVPGHELMERYEKRKNDEENKLLREQIEAAKKLLRENGFKVAEV